MGSKKRIVRLERKVLQAAAIGSLTLLRALLHSHAKPSRKVSRRETRKRERDADQKSAAREFHRRKKRRRSAEPELRESRSRGGDQKRKGVKRWSNSDEECEDSDDKEVGISHSEAARRRDDYRYGDCGSRKRRKRTRKADQRGRDLKREEVGEGFDSDGGSADSDFREEEEILQSKREQEIGDGGNGNGRYERSSSAGGKTSRDDGSSWNKDDRGGSETEPKDELARSESDIEEEANHIRSERKHASSGDTVRSIVNCRDAEGRSPLHHACKAGSEDLAKYLISKGASVHARDSKGNTPLHIATKLGPASLVAILKNAGADMEAFNDEGVTPSDVLDRREASSRRTQNWLKDRKAWYSHLAEELSDNEDPWWGGTEWGESDRPDWEDPRLERMADMRQGRGLYDNEPFSLRDFLQAEKNKTQSEQGRKQKRSGRHATRPPKGDKTNSPEVVIGPPLKISVPTQSYSQRWKTFSESYDLCLSYSSVPFPVEEGKEDTLREALLQGINPSMQRAALRTEMLKWHPDKFLQKWGAKLQGPDHDRIVARVNAISEAIHQLYKKLDVR